MCRAGFPGHFDLPWNNYDGVEIDFVIQYKHLTDAGYNVLTYDIRNHGNSSAASNGICGIGRWEWRDCVGEKKYVDSHEWREVKGGLGLSAVAAAVLRKNH
jgi:hypothetical protein